MRMVYLCVCICGNSYFCKKGWGTPPQSHHFNKSFTLYQPVTIYAYHSYTYWRSAKKNTRHLFLWVFLRQEEQRRIHTLFSSLLRCWYFHPSTKKRKNTTTIKP